MHPTIAILLSLVLAAAGCKNYSTVREIQPKYHSSTAAGKVIASTLKQRSSQPLARIGSYLDAASSAAGTLRTQPDNLEARRDYNFASARVFQLIHDNGFEPWKAPLRCPGTTRTWNLSIKRDPGPSRNPSNYQIEPADIYEFKGDLVQQRTVKGGLGAPLIVTSKSAEPEVFDQNGRVFYGMTGVFDFKGSDCIGRFIDPLSIETVQFENHSFPLAADFSAPVAMALARKKPRKEELKNLFEPVEFESNIRLARLQPYDPKKIPILCIHGLGDSQATWAPLIQTLRGDATIRKNYQFWIFSYPTGYPYPITASVLRRELDKLKVQLPNHKKIVVIGHSMGGMISRTLMTDSGMSLWNEIYAKPPNEIPFSEEERTVMTESLIFEHRDDVSRVIFMSASHRGANMATGFLGRLGSRLIGAPTGIVPDNSTIVEFAKPSDSGEKATRMPNSIDLLNPKGRFVNAMAKLPLTPDIPFHSIIGDQGKGGNLSYEEPVSSDGIVPYWSSHLDGARSEVIIPSDHWTNHHPLGIAEVDRILHEHLKGN
jgi:hypothetical protein